MLPIAGAIRSVHVEDEERSFASRLGWLWWMIGPAGLLAWFATLWFMFGDVL